MIRDNELTEWYPHDVKPVRIGYYEVRNDPGHPRRGLSHVRLVGNRRYWNGWAWLQWKDGGESVMGTHSMHQWRGVTEKAFMALASHLEKAMARNNTTSLEL